VKHAAPSTSGFGSARSPRRAPAAEDRVRDAEASRRRLLGAALEEFAAHGFAGARVQDIADRAGVNKQLISYYFGGKEGLYRGLQEVWQQREATFVDPGLTLEELAARYLRDALSDPRLMRLLIWRGLTTPGGQPAGLDLAAGLRRRQGEGEIAAELDPGAVLVALLGMVAAPIAMPQRVRDITGLDPSCAEFAEFYTDQLRRIVRRLAPPDHEPAHTTEDPVTPADPAPTTQGDSR